ncbi:MAG: hypothetical protein IJ323_02585 [Clostridia bacterium]|nr:hypothetical protein [Clostridia bacterium]
MFVYCKRCGLIHNTKSKKPICDACEIPMFQVPDEYLTESKFMFESREKRQEFEELIRGCEEYSEEAFLKRDDIIKAKKLEKDDRVAKKVSEYNESVIQARCPICHSNMLDKISNVGKVVKVGVFGILGAGDIGKKYRCKSCGYKF